MRPSRLLFIVYLLALTPTTPAAAGAAAPASPPAPSQVAQATLSAPARALGQQVGVAGAVRGEVRVAAHDSPAATVGIVTRSGDPIRLGDKVRSGPNSGLQIMLLDETVFSIGPDAEMTVDEFVFDPTTDVGSVAASISKGAFRFITGRVASKDPQRMNVRLPQATIGIRGTIVAGFVGPTASEVLLLGPGPDNNAHEKVGAITVANASGSVSIARAGFATTIAGQAPPSPPVQLPPERVRSITQQSNASTAPRGAPAPAGAPNASRQQASGPPRPNGDGPSPPPPLRSAPDAGMQLAGAQTFVAEQGAMLAPPPILRQLDAQAAQQAQSQLNAVTTYEQLRSVSAPTANFALNPIPLAATAGGGGGFFGFSASVNFAARTLTLNVNANYMLGSSPYSGLVYSDTASYAGSSGPTASTLTSSPSGIPPGFSPGFMSTGHTAELKIALTNNTTTGRIADVANVRLTVTDGTSTITGAGSVPRP
jgi:hypothetical protein